MEDNRQENVTGLWNYIARHLGESMALLYVTKVGTISMMTGASGYGNMGADKGLSYSFKDLL